MNVSSRIYIAGHRGLVGSAIMRSLALQGYTKLVGRSHAELDLEDGAATDQLFDEERPEFVFLAAAKVGGIIANSQYPADFITSNLAVQLNVIRAAWKYKVRRLIFLGSSCIYPKEAPIPIRENALLTGALEPTNRAYALAKIAGIELCWSYNRQHGTKFLAAMPTNLYGPGDNYDLDTSHVIPALLRKFHEAKAANANKVEVWGTGTPRREFLHSDDLATACVHLMQLDDREFNKLLGDNSAIPKSFSPPIVNIGAGYDISIADLAHEIARVTGYNGAIVFDTTKPDGTMRKLMDSSVIQATGWSPKIDFSKGLEHAYLLFRQTLSFEANNKKILVAG